MTTENENAEIAQDDVNVDETETDLNGQAESASAEESKGAYVETDNDRITARFAKLTAKSYADDKTVRDLKKENETLRAAKPVAQMPKEEDFDYDPVEFNKAVIKYEVNLKAKEIQEQQTAEIEKRQEQVNYDTVLGDFNNKVIEYRKNNPAYDADLVNLPEFPSETYSLLLKAKNPELVHTLAKNPDIAFELVGMDTVSAAMRIGQLSAQSSAKSKPVKQSSAPDPFDPIGSGGGASSEITGEASMEDIMKIG